LLLDTGIRASELCQLTQRDIDFKNSHIKVFRKGAKERSIPISPRTPQAIWKYTTAHNPDPSPHDTIFQNQQIDLSIEINY
jgi:integrase